MNSWEAITLDEWVKTGNIELGRGDVISKNDINNYKGPYPIYSSSAHNNGKFGEYAKFMFDEELITWSVDGGGSLFYRPKHKFSVTNVCGFMRIKSDKLNAPFIYYSLANQHKQLTFDYTTKAHPSVIRKLYWLPKIDVSIQEKISSILLTIDKSIEKTKALIEKYQQIKAGLMQDLFTRGVDADGKLRPPREQAPELYQETPVGWIPKNWDCTKLVNKAKPGVPHLRTGPFGSSLKGEHWVETGHPVITIGALGEGSFTSSELLFISDFDARRLSDFQMKIDDVVFSRVADVGRSVVIEAEQVGWIMSSNLMRISLDKELASSHFLQQQLSYDTRVKKQIRCKVNSGGREVANSAILNSLLFVWPTINEQNEIVRRADALSARVHCERNKLNKLYNQKSGLMHDLLTGKMQVPINTTEAEHV